MNCDFDEICLVCFYKINHNDDYVKMEASTGRFRTIHYNHISCFNTKKWEIKKENEKNEKMMNCFECNSPITKINELGMYYCICSKCNYKINFANYKVYYEQKNTFDYSTEQQTVEAFDQHIKYCCDCLNELQHYCKLGKQFVKCVNCKYDIDAIKYIKLIK